MRFMFPLLDRKKPAPPAEEAMFFESGPTPGPMGYSAGGDAIITIEDAYQAFVLDRPPIRSAYLPPRMAVITKPSWRLRLAMFAGRLRRKLQFAGA